MGGTNNQLEISKIISHQGANNILRIVEAGVTRGAVGGEALQSQRLRGSWNGIPDGRGTG